MNAHLYSTGHLRLPQISTISGIKRHTLNARVKNILQEPLNRNQGNQILLNPEQVRKIIDDCIINIPGKIIYVGNLKGGVGKTTISYILASATSSLGLKTCVIDLDVQSNLTKQYVIIDTDNPVFYDIIDNKIGIKEVIKQVSENLDIIPSSLKNTLIQKTLSMQAPKHHLSWFNSICLNFLRDHYDIIIVDTPPHLTTLNSVFCLCLTENDNILIPVGADEFSMVGVEMFLDDVMEIRKSYEITAETNISVIVNRFFQTQKNNLEMLLRMGQAYGSKLSEIIMRDDAKIKEIVIKKINFGSIKRGKEIYEVISNLLRELKILKK